MATADQFTSIPVHQSTLRALRGVKSAEQTWDDLLIALADDYIAPALKRELNRRLTTEDIVPGAEMRREYAEWSRQRGRPSRR